MTNLVIHLEKTLGPIATGWKGDSHHDFSVVRFDQVPIAGVTAFSTLGLGRHPMQLNKSGVRIRVEFMVLIRTEQSTGPIANVLHSIASEVVSAGRTYLRGEVANFRAPFIPESEMEAIYFTRPTYFNDVFSSASESGHQVSLVWLVPISRAESQFVAIHGWNAFEDWLETVDPDLTDISRPTMDHGDHGLTDK